MQHLKHLNIEQKKLLKEQGLNPKQFLLAEKTPFDFKFYDVKKKIFYEMRR